MKKRMVIARRVIGILLVLIGLSIEIYIPIKNMDMTGIRVLVTYPLEYLLSVIAWTVGYILIAWDR